MENSLRHELHTKAVLLSRQHKKLEAEIIKVLQEIDSQDIYRDLGYSSLFDYATTCLGFTDSVAYGFITVARKALEIPELFEALTHGVITVNTAKRITSAMTQENAAFLLEKASTMTQRELEREVAQINPRFEVKESARYISRERLEIKLCLSDEVLTKLQRVQNLESQKQRRPCNMEATIETMVEEYLKRHDPIQKAERAQSRKQKPFARRVQNKSRAPIPKATKHEVNLRDKAQCTFINPTTNLKCTNQRWLEVHHIKPVSLGGENTTNNLTTLCSGHHKTIHHLQLLL
jgi:5-methylcytosine-specific restriction endonuclease McrA